MNVPADVSTTACFGTLDAWNAVNNQANNKPAIAMPSPNPLYRGALPHTPVRACRGTQARVRALPVVATRLVFTNENHLVSGRLTG